MFAQRVYALSAVGVVLILAPHAAGNAFLGRGPPTVAMLPLLEELENIVGNDHRASTESIAVRIEDALRPTFQAMPKTSEGGVKPDAVRYMVHRYFVDRHGWFVDGLGSSAEASNSSSPATIFKDQVDDNVSELFEVRFQKHSFSLHQVAVFAATLERFVHSETLERLNHTYRVMGLAPSSTRTTEEQVKKVVEGYMILYVLGSNFSEVTPRMMRNMQARIHEVYPTWQATKKWVGEVHQEVRNSPNLAGMPANSFEFSTKVLEEIGDRYGRWQNSECVDLKTSLLTLEAGGTGRVPLDVFYGSALKGNWQFSESVAYLRQLGALDEADAQRPSVIIPNYINAPSNCVASSKFYSVCCIDECESLVSFLETRIAAPEASPHRIVELVSTLPSPTVPAPRILAPSLVQRLEEIAKHHHGMVPFHGRLFAQWMHHAYPRECSYPHMSGTLNPLTPWEYQKRTGQNASVDKSTMQWHIDMARRAPQSDSEEQGELPWTLEEELFVTRQQPPPLVQQHRWGLWAIGKGIAGVGAIFSVVFTILRMLADGKKAAVGAPSAKYYV